MAESSISMVHDDLRCSICLCLFKEPVTVPCGHSFCMSCITGCWDQNQTYSCPQCRQGFNLRPALGKNIILAEVVEKLNIKRKRKRKREATPCVYDDVECDVCSEDKNKAIKSCLTCLNSYCQDHLQQHENLFKNKRHKLTDTTAGLQELICPQHERMLELFCRNEECSMCICVKCLTTEHKSHETVSPEKERTEKEKCIGEKVEVIRANIEEKEKELVDLSETVETHKRSAKAAVVHNDELFTELIHFIRQSQFELTQLIRDQEKAVVSRAEDQMERLKQEIGRLRRGNSELEQLLGMQHHVRFLQRLQFLSELSQSTSSARDAAPSVLSHEKIQGIVSGVMEDMEYALIEMKDNVSRMVKYVDILPTAEFQSRDEFLEYISWITLDSNSAATGLSLSGGNRTVTRETKALVCPSHPDRFVSFPQVLCSPTVCARSYWEVEWKGIVGIGVSYKGILMRRPHQRFGSNDCSWCLYCSETSYFVHNNEKKSVPAVPTSTRIGVFVDYEAGTLSFYSVSDSMSLIHRVFTTFTEPLYPGFFVGKDSTIKIK